MIARLGWDGDWTALGGLRVTAPGWGPFAELNLDTKLRTQLMGGGRVALGPRFAIEGSGGAEYGQRTFRPAVRVELRYRLQ